MPAVKRRDTKRKRTAAGPPTKKKRVVTSSQGPASQQAIAVDSDDEEQYDDESLETILALIQKQEEDDARKKSLHDQLNGSAGPSTLVPPSSNQQAEGHSIQDEMMAFEGEDDEALARRLAQEWEEQDRDVAQITPGPIPPRSATRRSTHAEPSPSAQDVLSTHRDVFVATRPCGKCGKDFASPRGFVSYTPKTPPPSLLSLLHAICPSCRANHCRGCFTVTSCPTSCKGILNNTPCPVTICCNQVRAIALFEALGGFDRVYLSEQHTSEQRAREVVARLRSAVSSVGPGGTGYSVDNASPRAPAGPSGRKVAGTNNKSALENQWDAILVRALATITSFLPSPYVDDAQPYDMLPHETIPSLILMSKLPELLDSLLRNDSVTDWTVRNEVYSAMLGLLRRFADCELTMQVLVDQRWEVKKSCGIEEWIWQEGEIVWEKTKDDNPVIATPLYSHFKKLTRQCEAFLAGASQMLEGEGVGQDAGEETELIVLSTSLCGDMLAARDDIERAMTIMGKDPSTVGTETPSVLPQDPVHNGKNGKIKGNGKGKDRDPDIDIEKTYRQRCEQLAFRHVDIPNIDKSGYYHYAQNVAQTANATRNPKDRIHLIKELAVMATSLPPGIWVRIDDVRNDVIKVMIAGPEGTPYAGGLFEFDCFIPLQYPNTPPLMNLCTTGGGSVRFNPNLYNNGKVCLSLLGTWAGRPEEMWSPGKSTLLQVFVSIQSMILIDLPYFNEPGYGQANASNKQSQAYNKTVSLSTTRWAMVEWLKDHYRTGIWGDVIASHFIIREAKIRQCVKNCGANLLAAFDKGMEVVKGWKFDE